MPRLGLVARRIIPETIPAVGLVIMNGLRGHGRFLAVSSGTLKAKAPSSKPQAPGKLRGKKLQTPNSKLQGNSKPQASRGIWGLWVLASLVLGAWCLEFIHSLEVGLWLLELRAARSFRFGLDCKKAVWEQR